MIHYITILSTLNLIFGIIALIIRIKYLNDIPKDAIYGMLIYQTLALVTAFLVMVCMLAIRNPLGFVWAFTTFTWVYNVTSTIKEYREY